MTLKLNTDDFVFFRIEKEPGRFKNFRGLKSNNPDYIYPFESFNTFSKELVKIIN